MLVEVIQRVIDMASSSSSSNEAMKERVAGYAGMNAATKRYLELEIETLKNAAKDADELERI